MFVLLEINEPGHCRICMFFQVHDIEIMLISIVSDRIILYYLYRCDDFHKYVLYTFAVLQRLSLSFVIIMPVITGNVQNPMYQEEGIM